MKKLEMFCFQCEQTAKQESCTGEKGVCGKEAETAHLQDELTGSLITLATTQKRTKETDKMIIVGLFTTVTNVSFDNITTLEQIKATATEKPYDLDIIWEEQEDIRSLKTLILLGLRGMAAYAYHAMVLDYTDDDVNNFLHSGLSSLGKDLTVDELMVVLNETGENCLKCMAILDKANTETYGQPVPTEVPFSIEKGPFVVVSGHDLLPLKKILEQTIDRGVNVYTHGELLPAHGYPKLKAYSNLKGNFGTAWFNQQKEFDNLPASIVLTSNCLMPVKDSYKDRIYSCEVVQYPDMLHIDDKHDFTPVIEKAIQLGGFKEDKHMVGNNGGSVVTTGFGSSAVLSYANEIVSAVKKGEISHFFVVGGCDGIKKGRNYYTEFVKQAPKDSIILTLGCAKFRFNDLDLGDINGIPRILDMGQCNDAFGAIQVALALSKAFECEVNELPLTLILAWYEQKAVCVLLSLISLDIKNIYLGPTLPSFISPAILDVLVNEHNIKPISTPEKDLAEILHLV